MSSNLGISKTLELLNTLKRAVEVFAARADTLNTEFRSRTARERQLSENALADQTRQLTASIGETDAAYGLEKAAAEARFERRKARIGKACQAAKEHGLRSVEEQIGARKYELQKRILQSERDRDTQLAAAATAFAEFRRDLAAEQEHLAQMEGRAQRAFSGYGSLKRIFLGAYEKAEADTTRPEAEQLAEMRSLLHKAGGELDRFRRRFLLRGLSILWLLVVLALVPVGAVVFLQSSGHMEFGYPQAGGAAVGLLLVFIVARYLVGGNAAGAATSISNALAKARKLHDTCNSVSEVHYHADVQRLRTEFQEITRDADRQLKQAVAEGGQRRVSCRMTTDERTVRANQRNEQNHRTQLETLARAYHDASQTLNRAAEARKAALTAAVDQKLKVTGEKYEADWRTLQSEWTASTTTLYEAICVQQESAAQLFPPWDALIKGNWTPPKAFAHAAKFGDMQIDLSKLCSAMPKDERLTLPGPATFNAPACLSYPDEGSILFETSNSGQGEVVGALNNIVLRLLSVAPPGRINFTIIDPVGLGQNFAGVMHMADYEEQIISSRIWTQQGQIEERLAHLNEHMEKVIQMYLRNEYQSIAEYNEQAGVIAEKYHVLVVADFPAAFTETAAKRLLSIAASGARCGVYTLIHWDRRQPLPQDFIPDELRKSSVWISAKGAEFMVAGKQLPGLELALEAAPAPEPATKFIQQVGQSSRDSSRVEVPFEHVVPPPSEMWSEDTTSELRVAIGRTGATKLQYLAIGKGTRQHGLIAGKTGSGKSTLFHVIITNLGLWCSPEQVEFYLVDFKKGVEFKCYAAQRLPHARVVAIESDREFGLSVLQRVDDELKRRGDLFRKLGVQDIPGYKRAGGTEPVPRCLLMIDEFQEFFVEDDKIAQTASLLLDRIVRQGRAFGIHVLLGSQTLGGAYTVARTTLGQMVIRVALQCNEADAYLIMDDNNQAPRLLSRPGEGIYNDSAGAVEGNSPFQVVWLSDQVRDEYLAKIRAHAEADGRHYPGPIVFEGNAPADVRENELLNTVLEAEPVKAPVAGRVWLGAPNSIKGPTEAVFQRQSGNNLLIVGQREEATLALFALALVALAHQYPPDSIRLILFDGTVPGSPQREYLERVVQGLPQKVTMAKPGELPEVMKELSDELKRRTEDPDTESAPPVFLFIQGLQKYGKLRYEDDFGFGGSDADAALKPSAVLNSLVSEGARLGLHVIASCDSYNSVNRYLSRKTLSEFEMRVLFQMSANDSASLIENPKASTLGLHRALFYNAQEGHLETFRPYALPDAEWLSPAKA